MDTESIDILDLRIGNADRTAEVVGIETEVTKKGTLVYLNTKARDGAEFRVAQVWMKDHKGEQRCKALFVSFDTSGQIQSTSLLARLMRYLGVESVRDLIGKQVTLKAKKSGFLAILTDIGHNLTESLSNEGMKT